MTLPAAYGAAVTRFFAWCDARGLELAQISPVAVATYIEEMQGGYRAPTIKQHLAAIRRLFDWLVIVGRGVIDAHVQSFNSGYESLQHRENALVVPAPQQAGPHQEVELGSGAC